MYLGKTHTGIRGSHAFGKALSFATLLNTDERNYEITSISVAHKPSTVDNVIPISNSRGHGQCEYWVRAGRYEVH